MNSQRSSLRISMGRQKVVGSAIWLMLASGLAPAQESANSQKAKPPLPMVQFIDIGEQAGLTAPTIFGGVDTKKYILETTGTGVAIFDYDNDGWPDIFIVNGTTLEGFPPDKAPTNHLYHNNHDGTFTDVTAHAGLIATGWGQGVCVGDYDNDGWEDLYVTYHGKNRLYHNDHGITEMGTSICWLRTMSTLTCVPPLSPEKGRRATGKESP